MEQDLQQKIQNYRQLEEYLQSLIAQHAILQQKLKEIEATQQSIRNLEKEFHTTLGSGVFIKVEKKLDKFLVVFARDLMQEMSKEEVERFLQEKKKVLEDALKQLENEIVKVRDVMQQLAIDINKKLGQKNV